MHVRRGDYIDIGENLNVRFYEEAINLCKSKIDKFSFEVFTDDLKWVTEQNIFKNAKAIHGLKIILKNCCLIFLRCLIFKIS